MRISTKTAGMIALMLPFALAAQPSEDAQKSGLTAEKLARIKATYLKDRSPHDFVGLIALTDLGQGSYKGERGGLYPGGENAMPAAHRQAGERIAQTIVPLDVEGKPSKNGKIAMLAIGFSNPNLKFTAFQQQLGAYPERNPSLVAVNGCLGGQPAPVIANPKSNYWNYVDKQIKEAGITANQVQVIWMEQVIATVTGDFPDLAKSVQGYTETTLRNSKTRFPNLKLTYLASRSYGGYTEVGASPEPLAYENGFAVKWVVADQLAGKPDLNYDPAKGPVVAPWIAWGPYFWADGVKGRKDGLVLLRSDYRETDGLHPSEAGLKKFVKMMMDFFATDSTARPWFVKN